MKEEKKEEVRRALKQAKKLAWITIGYLLFDITVLYLTMQNSQAMKASWVEDLLYLIPSVSFLISCKISERAPNKSFRFGYDKVYSVGFIISSIALFAIGTFLFIESLLKLVNHEVITISTTEIFGQTIWFGWLMILAIGYSILPVYVIGKKKMKLAKKINVQILYADAKGQKADWLTSVATIVGILGIGLGYWWADAVAAIIISLDILSDGFTSLKAAIMEAMDRTPLSPYLKKEEPIVKEIEDLVEKESWIEDSLVRLRKAGNKVSGEVLIITRNDQQLPERIFDLDKKIREYHWEITNIAVSPVKELPQMFDKRI